MLETFNVSIWSVKVVIGSILNPFTLFDSYLLRLHLPSNHTSTLKGQTCMFLLMFLCNFIRIPFFFKLQNTESLPKLLLSVSPVKKESSSSLYDIFYITLGKLSSYNYAPLKSSCQIFPCSLCPLFPPVLFFPNFHLHIDRLCFS